MLPRTGPEITAPTILALVGGTMAALGSLLPWASASVEGISLLGVSGFDTGTGKLTFVCGAVTVAVGALGVMGSPLAAGVPMWVLVAAGALTAGLGASAVANAEDLLLGAADDAARTIAGQLDLGAVAVTAEAGLHLVIAGGVLAAVGGALMVIGARSARSASALRSPDEEDRR